MPEVHALPPKGLAPDSFRWGLGFSRNASLPQLRNMLTNLYSATYEVSAVLHPTNTPPPGVPDDAGPLPISFLFR